MIDVPERSEKKSRRDFLSYVFSIGFFGWISSLVYPLYSYVASPKLSVEDITNIEVGKFSEFEVNSSRMFRINKKPGILIKNSEGELKAFSAVCSHLQCTVQFNKEENVFKCPCHFGKYDLNGKNISGPPPKPLTSYDVVIKNDVIFVRK